MLKLTIFNNFYLKRNIFSNVVNLFKKNIINFKPNSGNNSNLKIFKPNFLVQFINSINSKWLLIEEKNYGKN